MDDCIFCKIADGRIPADKVLENDLFVAFRDINPQAAQHVLVIPREHIQSLNDVAAWQHGEGQALLEFMVAVARELGIADSGYRVVSNSGADARQIVQHLHFHVLGGEDLGDF
jgi:histidine triad (HIT) family protein